MDTNPTETVQETDVSEKDTNIESEQDSSSSQEADYEALIEAERKPDPEKAKEAFKKRQEKRHEEETEPEEEDGDKPMTRKEMEEYLARRTQEIVATANAERIQELAGEMAESDGEKRFIMEIHKNRVFPDGMSLREQLEEARAIATYKRTLAKNTELARKVTSKETASKDISTGIQETTSSEPKVNADVKVALKNAGFVYDNTHKTYVKTLPNGKKMFRDPKTGRTGML